MPKIGDIKNYFIESEEDIPIKYREEIEKRLEAGENIKEINHSEIISGKMGKVISEESEIEDLFKDDGELYLGHGTPNKKVISSILKRGLRTVNSEDFKFYSNTLRGLDSTTISFGEGNKDLFAEQKELLNNWPHKNSRNIVIVSIPKKYALRATEVGWGADLYQAFYTENEEKGYSLRPEFIKGIYDADTKTFTSNENFYQNLESQQQESLFKEISQQYVRAYAEFSKISPEETTLPLNDNELDEVTIEWYKMQLKNLRKDKKFDSEMLDTQLHEISEDLQVSDFHEITHSIKNHVQQEKENINEGWLVDDEWR